MSKTYSAVRVLGLDEIRGNRKVPQYGTGDVCIKCRATKLSRYNKTRICGPCTKEMTTALVNEPTNSTLKRDQYGAFEINAPRRKEVQVA